MKLKSLKINIIVNTVRTSINIITPIITFPYASRILAPSGIGKINYINAIVSYFILFSSLGIPLYGIREIAKIRENKHYLTKTFFEIIIINIVSMIFVLVLYFIIISSLDLFYEDYKIYVLYSLKIILITIGFEWFYKGLEKYLYITLISILFKVISIVYLFLFVKSKNNIFEYAIFTMIIFAGSNIFNLFYIKKFLTKIKVSDLNILKHIKGILIVFLFNLTTSLYIVLDKVMIGSLANQVEVGYYTAANKLVKLVNSIGLSVGAVLIPRISYYLSNKKYDSFKSLIRKSINFTLFFSLPAIAGLLSTSNEIILLFSGKEFVSSVPLLKIMSPIILFIGISNIVGIQVLYPMNKEKLVIFSVVIGAITNILLNFKLIPILYSFGAAIGTVIGELTVIIVQLIIAKRFLPSNLISKESLKYLISSLSILLLLTITKPIFTFSIPINLLLKVFLGSLIYFSSLIIMREKHFTLPIIKKIKGET